MLSQSVKYNGLSPSHLLHDPCYFQVLAVDRYRDVLLEVWREACRHIEIAESTATIDRIIARHLPISALLVRRIDLERSSVETVATGGAPAAWAEVTRNEHPSSDGNSLIRWCRRGEVDLAARGESPPYPLRYLVPKGVDGDVLAGPLGPSTAAPGVLLLVAKHADRFTEQHRELARALLDPFSAALANDHQLRELAKLREAAEAQNRSLLSKLGRRRLDDTIVGAESGLKAVMERIELVVDSDVPVLIFGETGTGKELIARAIHSRSPRRKGPVIRVNCGAIPPELIDSELFGHQRGAFTGAAETRRGGFERADGGTLFLDEIGELPPAVQVRLLRVLQDGCLQRVGGEQMIHVDVRIVAATNRDLSAMVAEGLFREDLWYRIAVFPIVLPPLRERQEDIPTLAEHFARRAAIRFGLAEVAPSEGDLQILKSYPWPGNVRELGAVIDRAAILGDGQTLQVAAALGVAPTAKPAPVPPPPQTRPGGPAATAMPPLDAAIRQHIESALEQTGGRVEGPRGAAVLLDINPHTLRSKMRKLKIDWKKFRPQ